MKEVWLVLKEQFVNARTILRLSRYEEKATYQSHYLGMLWQFLNPLIQIGIYYLVFGLGVNGGRNIDGVPFIVWMLIGIITWFFINSSMLGGSNSIYKQVGVVSKMKFPVSILPTTNFVSQLTTFFIMTIFLLFVLVGFHIYPSIYWVQYIYYFISMIIFVYAFGIFNATMTTLIRDYHIALQSLMRILFFISGPIWSIDSKNIPAWIVQIIKINPIYYIIEGFRDTLLSREWFWNKGTYGTIFWLFTFILLIIGSHLHLKFRSKFVELI